VVKKYAVIFEEALEWKDTKLLTATGKENHLPGTTTEVSATGGCRLAATSSCGLASEQKA
jgi:hypothetical protein